MNFKERLEQCRTFCMEPGWWDNDTPAISELMFQRTEELIQYIPTNYHLSPCPDGSFQWEWEENRKNNIWIVVEVYEDFYRLTREDGIEHEETDLNKFIQLLKTYLPHKFPNEK